MKKSFVFVLLSLILSFSPVLADGKANVKVGPVKAVVDTNKNDNDNVVITKSTSLFNVTVSATRLVISSNPSTTNLAVILSFTTDEEDFVRGQTYDLGIADSLTTNAVILASYTRGSKGGGVVTTVESKVTGTLKVTSYDSETGRLRGTINAKLFPAEINSVSSGTKAATKPVPISIKLDAILE